MHYPIIHEYLKHFLLIAINLKKKHKHLEREGNVSVATPYMHIYYMAR